MVQAVNLNLDHKLMRRVRRIHFIGIGGSGMSGIAEVLSAQNYRVSGSDIAETPIVRALRSRGIHVVIGHNADNLKGVDVAVYSSAISEHNPEMIAAKEQRIPLVPRAQMLAEIMRMHHGIAVSGTHGKTTTTSMIAHVLASAGMDPTYIIGGRLQNTQRNAALGKGHIVVAEADESDASFLHLRPIISVITNIEPEHLNNYAGDFAQVKQAYITFVHNLPFYGMVAVCLDDPVIAELCPQFNRTFLSYGLTHEADIYATNIEYQGLETSFTACWRESGKKQKIRLGVPGQHNVLNALATLVIAQDINIDLTIIARALASFNGVGRRLEALGTYSSEDVRDVSLFDDYGHHPSELKATLNAVHQSFPMRRLVMIFQPHRYTRLRDLYDEFTQVLGGPNGPDALILLPVYAAGEDPLPDINANALARSIRQLGRIDPVLVNNFEELAGILPPLLRSQDIVLTQGAGTVGQISARLAENGLFLSADTYADKF